MERGHWTPKDLQQGTVAERDIQRQTFSIFHEKLKMSVRTTIRTQRVEPRDTENCVRPQDLIEGMSVSASWVSGLLWTRLSNNSTLPFVNKIVYAVCPLAQDPLLPSYIKDGRLSR